MVKQNKSYPGYVHKVHVSFGTLGPITSLPEVDKYHGSSLVLWNLGGFCIGQSLDLSRLFAFKMLLLLYRLFSWFCSFLSVSVCTSLSRFLPKLTSSLLLRAQCYSITLIYYNFFVHSPIDGHPLSFPFFATTKRGAVNICVWGEKSFSSFFELFRLWA